MKTIYLLRHAKSSWKDEGIEDFDRPLNKRGRVAAAALGAHLARQHVLPAQVLCSSSKRTRETWGFLQDALGSVALPVRFEKGIYLAEPAALLRRVRRLDDSLASVMLIGHNPGLAQFATLLAGDGDEDARRQIETKFPTGALAVLEAGVDRWLDLAAHCCRLLEFLRTSDLPDA